jgi:hypothetical protein
VLSAPLIPPPSNDSKLMVSMELVLSAKPFLAAKVVDNVDVFGNLL